MQRNYTYQNYKADLDSLILAMSEDENEVRKIGDLNNNDDMIFMKDMRCLHKLSGEWVNLLKADSTLKLIAAGRALLQVYKETRFSTCDYYPGVVGPRSLKLAQQYLELMRKAQTIIVPKVGNIVTQPAIEIAAEFEKKDGRRCIKKLEGLINQHRDNNASLHCRPRR